MVGCESNPRGTGCLDVGLVVEPFWQGSDISLDRVDIPDTIRKLDL